MRFSDAIEAGAAKLNSPGPDFRPHQLTPNLWAAPDVLLAAQIGLLGRMPTTEETRTFYYDNPWAPFSSDMEMWCRMAIFHEYKWNDVIKKLREYNA